MLFGAAIFPSIAQAHGGLPRIAAIHVDDAAPDRIVVQADGWGLFRTDDFGQIVRFTCAEVFGNATGAVHESLAVLSGGALLVASFDRGLMRSDPTTCGWTPDERFTGYIVYDVAAARDGTLYVVAEAVGAVGVLRVRASSDDGSTWSDGVTLPGSLSSATLAVSPADSSAVFVAARTPSGSVVVLRSGDGGGNWESRAELPADGGVVPRIAAPFRTDGERLFLRLDAQPVAPLAPEPADTLLMSDDGGVTWPVAFASSSDLPGLAVSPDELTVAVAGPEDGILVGSVGGAGVPDLERVYADPVWALAWTMRGLLAGLDDFPAGGGAPRGTLALSEDGGRTFRALFGVCDVELASCELATSAGAVCGDAFGSVTGFGTTFSEGPRCAAPDGGRDGGGGTGRVSGSSCGCRVVGPRGEHADYVVGSVFVLGALLGRRRRGGGGSRLPGTLRRLLLRSERAW